MINQLQDRLTKLQNGLSELDKRIVQLTDMRAAQMGAIGELQTIIAMCEQHEKSARAAEQGIGPTEEEETDSEALPVPETQEA